VLGIPTHAPKIRALKQEAELAVTIDTDTIPHKVLLARGAI
jgi:hypothetical protein